MKRLLLIFLFVVRLGQAEPPDAPEAFEERVTKLEERAERISDSQVVALVSASRTGRKEGRTYQVLTANATPEMIRMIDSSLNSIPDTIFPKRRFLLFAGVELMGKEQAASVYSIVEVADGDPPTRVYAAGKSSEAGTLDSKTEKQAPSE